MSGWGKYTVKYEKREYDTFNDEEMSFEFFGSSDVGTFEIKGKDNSMWSNGKEYGYDFSLNIDQLKAMKEILDKFFEEY